MPKCKAPECGEAFKREKINGQPDLRVTWCSIDCALIIARARQDKAHAKTAADTRRARLKREKANRKDLRDLNRRDKRWQHKQTQRVFNRLRRLEEFKWFADRGIEPYCISCRKTNMDWACGHFVSVGAGNSILRYDPLNTWLQCNKNCNSALSSNRQGYEEGLVIRFGEARAQSIITHCKAGTKPIQVTWQELEEMRAGFSARVRELENMAL